MSSKPGPRMGRNESKVGEVIRACRRIHKMTQPRLGELIGVSAETVSHWERGEHEPGLGRLNKVRKLFGLTWDEFLGPAFE